ncbi:chaperone HtpG, partial [Neisseria wadsworthii 9715]
DYSDSDNLFGSDCCTVLPKEQVLPRVRPDGLITHVEDGQILPENRIPDNIDIRDYGVGNFYLEVKQLLPGPYFFYPKEKTFQIKSSEIFFMNNCGDILWQPYYYGI